MKVLVINAGSSSLKYQLIDMDTQTPLAKGLCERIGIDGKFTYKSNTMADKLVKESPMKDHSDAISIVLAALVDPENGVVKSMDEINAVGHRVVHGAEDFASSCVITDEVMETLKKCSPLAPLHNPANIIGIEACAKLMPGVPQVAVFDTAFHQTMPEKAFRYALPNKFYKEDRIRKYGFHGTSHKYISGKAAETLGVAPSELKIVTCHLGNGSSVAAVDGGKCVDTSMGFTPLDGTVMGTRCGSIDPAVVTYLLNKGLSAAEVDKIMNKESGVQGISEVSSDFRDLANAAAEGNKNARLALDMFIYSVKKYIGAYAVAMGGINCIVFAGGIGENDSEVRGEILKGLEFLGVDVDWDKNNSRGTATLSKDSSKVKVLVIETNEELMIAMDTESLVK